MGARRTFVASLTLFAVLGAVGNGRAANGRATLLPATRRAEEYEELLKHEVEPAERLRLLGALVECYRESAENGPRAGARDSAWRTLERLAHEFPQALETLEAGLGLARLNVRLLARFNTQECNQHLYGRAFSSLEGQVTQVRQRLVEEQRKKPPDQRVVHHLEGLLLASRYEAANARYAYAVTLGAKDAERPSLLAEAAKEFAGLAFDYRDTDTGAACQLAQGVCLKAIGDLTGAERAFLRLLSTARRARGLRPLGAQARFHLTTIMYAQRRLTEADAAALEFRREFPVEAASSLGQALALEQARAYLTEARMVAESDPASPQLRSWLQKAVGSARQISPLDPAHGAAAVEVIFGCAELSPKVIEPTPEERFARAQARFSAGKYEDAVALYGGSLSHVEESLPAETRALARLRYGVALYSRERFEEAGDVLETVDTALLEPSVCSQVMLLRADVYQHQTDRGHDTDLSQRRRGLLEEIVAARPLGPATTRARLTLAQDALREQRYREGLATLSPIAPGAEEEALALLLEARCYWGLYQQAHQNGDDIGQQRRLLEEARKRLVAIGGQGQQLQTDLQARAVAALMEVCNSDVLARYSETVALAERALAQKQLPPELRRAILLAKVQALGELGRFAEAAATVVLFHDGLPQGQVLPQVALGLARRWRHGSHSAETPATVSDIVQLVDLALTAREHMDADLYLLAGEVLAGEGEHTRAARVLEEGLARADGTAPVTLQRLRRAAATAYVNAGEPERGVSILDGTEPTDWPLGTALSWALAQERVGRYAEALEGFRRISAIGNRTFEHWMEARYHLALNLHRLERHREALQVLVISRKLYANLASSDQLALLTELEARVRAVRGAEN